MTTRLTSAQIVALGEYLEPEFDPSTLTVSQLLGVLGYHNVPYPTPYSKPKLIQRFEEEIKKKGTKLKKERLKKANSIASDDGITDGLTGKPLGKASSLRRSSRRLSKVPAATTDEETSPVRQEPVKRRRSSAQPVLGGTTSRRKAPTQINTIQESESETEELPVKKVGKTKKSGDASTQARRISLGDDSGWEDNNIFQSGAEDSPVRPTPARPKASRKSVGARRSRKSFSAPPQPSPPSSPVHTRVARAQPAFSPQAVEFKPDLPFSPFRELRLPPQSPFSQPVQEASQEDADTNKQENVQVEETQQSIEPAKEETPVEVSGEERTQADEQREAISRRVAESVEAVRRRPIPPESPSWSMRLILTILLSIIAYHVRDYKIHSAAIGYCDAGTNTSRAVEEVKAHHLLVKECNRENRTTLLPLNDATDRQDMTVCPLPPLIPIPQPESCTPCPEHASCSQFSVTCETGYLLQPNSLVFFLPPPPSISSLSISIATSPSEFVWGTLSDSLNGLPGLGSIALPPRCLEDPNRKRHIGALERAIGNTLAKERGRRVCVGGKITQQHVKDAEGGEAKKWGVELTKLKETMRKRTPVNLLPTFEDTFDQSIQQLVKWGDIIIGEDTEGRRYFAHKTPELTWDCTLVVRTRDIWHEWKSTVFGAFATFFGAILLRLRYVQRKAESRRVGELVQIALDTLRNQEIAHHTDPVTAPQPYLSSLQLRDLILQEEHSVPIRRRLWDQVERIVEGNANVRVNMEEVEGGDELRVWRWVGSSRGRRMEGLESPELSPYASPKPPADRS